MRRVVRARPGDVVHFKHREAVRVVKPRYGIVVRQQDSLFIIAAGQTDPILKGAFFLLEYDEAPNLIQNDTYFDLSRLCQVTNDDPTLTRKGRLPLTVYERFEAEILALAKPIVLETDRPATAALSPIVVEEPMAAMVPPQVFASPADPAAPIKEPPEGE